MKVFVFYSSELKRDARISTEANTKDAAVKTYAYLRGCTIEKANSDFMYEIEK